MNRNGIFASAAALLLSYGAEAQTFHIIDEPPAAPGDPDKLPGWRQHVEHMTHPVTDIIGPMHKIRHNPHFKLPKGATGLPPSAPLLSSNWDGYIDTMSAFHPDATTQMVFVVPQPVCKPGQPQAMSIWPGFGGFQESDLLQAGVDILDEDGSCNFDTFAFAEWFPDDPIGFFNVHPNDIMSVIVQHIPNNGGFSQVSVVDYSTGDSVTMLIECGICQADSQHGGVDPFLSTSVEWIVEAPGIPTQPLLQTMAPVTVYFAEQFVDGALLARTPDDRPTINSYEVSTHDAAGNIIAFPTLLGPYSFNVQTYP
jgi:hypothetical protein